MLAIVRVEDAEPPAEMLTVPGFNELGSPFGDVAERVTIPENALRLVTVIVDVADEPAVILSELGRATIEKSAVVELAGWTASAIISQYQVASSPKDTGKFVTGGLTSLYSKATPPGPAESSPVNPGAGVRVP